MHAFLRCQGYRALLSNNIQFFANSEPLLCSLTDLKLSSKAASEQPEQTNELDWREHTRKQFSTRPSFLSPLFREYQREKNADQQRKLVSACLAAHHSLSEELDGYDEVQAINTLRRRISEIKQLSDDLMALKERKNLPSCQDRSLMYGYYELLEKAATEHDPDAVKFMELAQGREDVWTHWYREFVDKYKNTPNMRPLHEIYSKPDPLEIIEKVKGIQSSQGKKKRRHHHYVDDPLGSIDIDGVARTVGTKKSCIAQVVLFAGTGRFIINNQPYDYFLNDWTYRAVALQPFFATGMPGRYDVYAVCKHGGRSSQGVALRQAIAKALVLQNEEFRPQLSRMIKRDIRQNERKKTGQPGSRKKYKWVKR